MQLDCDTPLDFTLESMEVRAPEADPLLAFLNEMEFRTLTKRVADSLKVAAPVAPEAAAADAAALPFDHAKYENVSTEAALQVWIDQAYARGYVAVDTETTSLDEMQAELVGISLCIEPGRACYIPLGHKQGGGDLFGSTDLMEGQLPLDGALAMLRPMLEDASILKIGQNMKYDAKIFARQGMAVAPIDDTMLMSSALNAGLHNHGMDTLSDLYLGHTPIPIKSLLGAGKAQITFDRVPVDEAVKYAAEDADITLRLWQLLKPLLHTKQVTTVYETLERPLVPVLAQMEMAGIQVDRDTLSRMSNTFAQKIQTFVKIGFGLKTETSFARDVSRHRRGWPSGLSCPSESRRKTRKLDDFFRKVLYRYFKSGPDIDRFDTVIMFRRQTVSPQRHRPHK